MYTPEPKQPEQTQSTTFGQPAPSPAGSVEPGFDSSMTISHPENSTPGDQMSVGEQFAAQSFAPGQSQETEGTNTTEFPLGNECYDVISILYQKSKALEAYEKYLQDMQSDNQLRQLLIQIRHDEQKHLEQLKNHLGRLLYQKPGSGSTGDASEQQGGDIDAPGARMPGD